MTNVLSGIKFEDFPEEMRNSLEVENSLLLSFIHGDVVDVGCGDCRPLVHIIDGIKSYTGIELEPHVYSKAVEVSSCYDSAQVIRGDAVEILSETDLSFDTGMILWNTLTLFEPEQSILEALTGRVSDKIYLSLARRGCLDLRLQYYRMYDEPYAIGPNEEIISSLWGTSKAYTYLDLESFQEILAADLVDAGNHGEYLIYGLYEKR